MAAFEPETPPNSICNILDSLRTKARSLSPQGLDGVGDSDWKLQVLKQKLLSMYSCSSHSRSLFTAMRSQLVQSLKQRELLTLTVSPPSSSSPSSPSQSSYSNTVSCMNCQGFMVQPVCMPCGHSVCKGCLGKSTMLLGDNIVCPACAHSFPRNPEQLEAGRDETASDSGLLHCRMPTLTLQNAFRKWYPLWVESCRCREEGNKHANQGNHDLATEWYTRALESGKGFVAMSSR